MQTVVAALANRRRGRGALERWVPWMRDFRGERRAALEFQRASTEYRLIAAASDLEDERLVRAFGRKVQLDALPQIRGGDANDIVLATVVVWRSLKDLDADLLLVYLRAAILQRLSANIEQKIP